jgi:glycine hydroxymethyltransferase
MAERLMKHKFKIISGGTDNHLMLVDVTSYQGITGKLAEQVLDKAGITVNKNLIPFDTRPPLDPSGIRIGTPCVTTRGMKQYEMERIADWIAAVLSDPSNESLLKNIHKQVMELAHHFPAPVWP